MRAFLILIGLLSLPWIGFTFYWYSGASELEGATEDNIEMMQRALAETGEGLSFTHGDLEVKGYPFTRYVRVEKPTMVLQKANRVQEITADYIDVYPRGESVELYELGTPENFVATDRFQGQEFVYSISFGTSLPSLMFRTPTYEKRLPKRAASFMGEGRITPDDILVDLPEDIVHQASLSFPGQLFLAVSYGDITKQITFQFARSPRRLWQPIKYRIAGPYSRFFDVLTEAIHYTK